MPHWRGGGHGFDVHATGSIINRPGHPHRAGGHGALLQGHQGIGHRQHHHRGDQGQHRAGGDRLRRRSTSIPANWHPYIPPNTGIFGQFGWSGIWQASAIIFFAYIGFDGVSTVAQEAKNPARGMPLGMLGSLGICTLLYILMSSVMTGLVPIAQLNDAAPVVAALEPHPRADVAEDLGDRRRAGGPDLGHHHDDHSAGAHLADDGARRPAASSSSAPCIRASRPRTWPRRSPASGRDLRRPAAHRHSGRAGIDRHAGRLHRGLHRRHRAALHAARSAAALQGQGRLVRGRHGRALLQPHGLLAAERHLVAPAGWSLLGFAIYFFYSYKHSRLRRGDAASAPAPSR